MKTDIFGNELKVGSYISYVVSPKNSSDIKTGRIIKINKHSISVIAGKFYPDFINDDSDYYFLVTKGNSELVNFNKMILLPNEYVTDEIREALEKGYLK